jgi:hypothetical protein
MDTPSQSGIIELRNEMPSLAQISCIITLFPVQIIGPELAALNR